MASDDSDSWSVAFMREKYSKLAESIEATGSAIRNFARQHRNARPDLVALSHQLVELGSLIDLWQHEASTSDDIHGVVRPFFPRIQRILERCHEVLLEVEGLLKAYQTHDWIDSIKTKLNGMVKHLDTCTISLDIALEISYM